MCHFTQVVCAVWGLCRHYLVGAKHRDALHAKAMTVAPDSVKTSSSDLQLACHSQYKADLGTSLERNCEAW